jgi:UDP-glucose 4-epimerase
MGGVDYVVHAAAMKQIPSCEDNPEEAISTNVGGTANVLRAARNQGVECVVNLSADKAVYSVSVYGATKFLSEKLVVDSNRLGKMRSVNLRYSNILDSRGGVFEVFTEKLKSGQTATVFDSTMTRFFLTQEEIVHLCLFAFENCKGGETLIKLASPVRIAELATIMKDVIGRGEVEIHDNTARTGEKLDAVLLADEEKSSSKAYGEIIIVNHLGRELALQNLTEVSDDQIDMESRAFLTGIDLEQLVRSTLA